jgi:hypothetical protein
MVDEIWYCDLRHARSFYNNVTAKQLMDHLDANCGGLYPVELVSLPTEMMQYYAQIDGIPEYINKLEEAQRKLARANLPMLDDQLLAIASTSVLASGHFPRSTDEWEAKPCNQKTWTAWKAHYRDAHLARKRQMLAAGTAGMGGGGMANAVTAVEDATILDETLAKLDGYLDNLAAAATTEKSTLAQLVENNATLTVTITSLTASVSALSTAYTILAAKVEPGGSATAAPTHGKARAKTRSKSEPGGYCWTHGYRVAAGHNSITCKGKADGHKDAATRANTMGGSMENKGWNT